MRDRDILRGHTAPKEEGREHACVQEGVKRRPGRLKRMDNIQRAVVSLTRVCDLNFQLYYLGKIILKNENVDHCYDYIFSTNILGWSTYAVSLLRQLKTSLPLFFLTPPPISRQPNLLPGLSSPLTFDGHQIPICSLDHSSTLQMHSTTSRTLARECLIRRNFKPGVNTNLFLLQNRPPQ